MEATDTAVERRIRESPSSRLYRANMRPANVAVHLLRVPKAVLTGPIVPGHSFAAEFKALFATLAMRRKSSRITNLSDVAEADMVRCSIRKAYPPVDHHLGQIDPNQQLLDKVETYHVTVSGGTQARLLLSGGARVREQRSAAPQHGVHGNSMDRVRRRWAANTAHAIVNPVRRKKLTKKYFHSRGSFFKRYRMSLCKRSRYHSRRKQNIQKLARFPK